MHIDINNINFGLVDSIIHNGIAEDTGKDLNPLFFPDIWAGDHTSLATIPDNQISKAKCLIKGEGILAGMQVAQRIFQILDDSIQLKAYLKDGDKVSPGQIAFEVEGKTQILLTAERLSLNIMQRMSGIATQTRHLVNILDGLPCQLLDTRKTTPLIRYLEKWAVVIGGAANHRYGLFDMILIKDNHIDVAGGVIPAIERTLHYLEQQKSHLPNGLPIVIETRTLEEVAAVADFGQITRILLDNMDVEMLQKAVKIVNGRFPTEASGNITEHNLRAKAETGVDYISVGALTHSFKSLDISLKITI